MRDSSANGKQVALAVSLHALGIRMLVTGGPKHHGKIDACSRLEALQLLGIGCM